jgi:hypothetical protein
MGASGLHTLILVAAIGAGPSSRPAVVPGKPLPGGELGAEDARFLDWLMEDFVFDPRRAAAFVRVETTGGDAMRRRTLRQLGLIENGTDLRAGWLVRGTNGDPDRIYFADGESIVAPPTGVCVVDFASDFVGRTGPLVSEIDRLQRMLVEISSPDTPDLVRACWLHRRGYDGLTAVALSAARDTNDNAVEAVRVQLARRANEAAVQAFAERDDSAALAHAARLYALYPDVAVDYGFHAGAVASDIVRRHHSGIGSREPPTGPPAEFATWDNARKIAFLIGSLDEVSPGDSQLETDWRVAELVRVGDPAVPALIDALEHDSRLTRRHESRMHINCCGKGLGRNDDKVQPVADVAKEILGEILRATDFDPTGPRGDTDGTPAVVVARLRRYWAAYGDLPLAERMMAILTEPTAHLRARRDAAKVLASWPNSMSSWSRDESRPMSGTNPMIARFNRPTVADAIFTAMSQGIAERDPTDPRWRGYVEAHFLRSLVELGDPRAGPELARLAAAALTPVERLDLAEAAYRLGTTGPLVALTREVMAGTVPLPPTVDKDTSPQIALHDLLQGLLQSGLPEADAALYAVADPGHPYFPLAAYAVSVDYLFGNRQNEWRNHPVCVAVLRHALTDRRPTGGHSYLRGDQIEEEFGGKPRVFIPAGGADPKDWHEHVEHTRADDAADRLGDIFFGLPEYHPLRKDAARVLAETRAVLLRHYRHVRKLTWDDQRAFGIGGGNTVYVADIRPLGRPATATDVDAGRAVFELRGAGRVTDQKLPAWITLRADAKHPDASKGLVVQAEVGPDGKAVYGVIFRHAIRAVKAEEVERVEPAEMR